MERFLQMNTLSGKSHGRIRKAYCLSSAVHHLDFALLHLDGGRSPYMNRNLLSMECKHSKPTISYSCTAHFSTKIVPTSKKRARKCPFYSNSVVPNLFLMVNHVEYGILIFHKYLKCLVFLVLFEEIVSF